MIGKIVKKFRTSKMTCLSCKRSFNVLKGGELECGECDHCQNTSFHVSEGRPWGIKSKAWEWASGIWMLDPENRVTSETVELAYEQSELPEHLVFAD